MVDIMSEYLYLKSPPSPHLPISPSPHLPTLPTPYPIKNCYSYD
ncbi:hypothetical protein [Moorena producens]|nr:hypothetical protein [Moorena producens]